MIVERDKIKSLCLKELSESLTSQKYPKQIIENGINKASSMNQSDLRKSKENNDEEVLAFINTYNPNNPNIFPFIKNSIQQLKASKKL